MDIPRSPFCTVGCLQSSDSNRRLVVVVVDAVATAMRCSLGVNVQEKNRARLVLKAHCFLPRTGRGLDSVKLLA